MALPVLAGQTQRTTQSPEPTFKSQARWRSLVMQQALGRWTYQLANLAYSRSSGPVREPVTKVNKDGRLLKSDTQSV